LVFDFWEIAAAKLWRDSFLFWFPFNDNDKKFVMLVEKMRALQLIESFVYKLKLDVKEIMTRVSVTWS